MSASGRVPIPGSERELDSSHVRTGDVDPQAEVEVTVYLAHRAAPDWVDAAAQQPPAQRRRVAREDWADAHGAAPESIQQVRTFAADHGLEVVDADAARRTVRLRGTVKALGEAFGVQFAGRYAVSSDAGAASYRGRRGPLTVPQDLDGVITGVFGLDDRPQAQPRIRFAAASASASAGAAAAAGTSYTPPEVAAAYGFPSSGGGAGHAVGIVELGGGFDQGHMRTYFASIGVSPGPTLTAVSVDGGANSPGTDTNADGEVQLDIEVVGSIVPHASIAVYFATNTDQGFLDAVSEAVHDTTHAPTAVSISWGSSEDGWTGQARTQMEQILTDAAGLGVTVTVAAGDNGSTDGATDGRQHVDFPASAPHALACGGTTLALSGASITSETVWGGTANDGATGGGVSDVFAQPAYQSAAKVPDNVDTGKPGRGVPDVCGDADPQTGYAIQVDGTAETVGGTSAVAPLWAALIVLLSEAFGAPVGYAQPRLYPLLGSAAFHDIISGSNGAYSAGPGWDACSGLGSPVGSALATQLGAAG